MRYNDLLQDATGSPPGASQQSQHIALCLALNERHPSDNISMKGVAKWFARKSIPSKWLLRIAALPTPPLNLNAYA